MAHVLTYWRFPDEEARFLDYLERTGDILACTSERVPDPESELLRPRPLRQLIEELNPDRLLMGPRECWQHAPVGTFEKAGQVLYGRFYMRVPLVSYWRGEFEGPKRLGVCNLVFESIRSNGDLDNPIWTPQEPEFIAWGKRVIAWARRHAPRVVNHKRMTERVYAALDSGLELVH